MKKIFTLFIGLVLLPLSLNAADFQEGTNYEVLGHAATKKPELLEFFSFYCPHCMSYEPFMDILKENLPSDVEIKKNHVNFLGGNMGSVLTQVYAAAKLLKVEDEIAKILFNTIHIQHKNINSEQDILDIFEQVGVSNKDAEAALQSFPANSMASQMRRNTEVYGIRGVPTLIVNGRYKVNTGSVKSIEEFTELVSFLTKKTD